MSQFTAGNTPGFQAEEESQETQVLWSGRNGQTLAATKKVVLDAANVDAGNTPTTTLRGGHLIAIDDAGEAHLYAPDAADGKQNPVGILEHAQDMLVAGVATDRFTQVLVQGLVKEGELINLDPRAKQQLAARFVFDQSLTQIPGELMQPRAVYRVSGNVVLSAADNGKLYVATAAANFTLPTKANGLAFRILQTADANLVVTGSSDIIALNNAAASSITYSTSNQKIGSQLLIECVYTATSTLRWIATNLGGTTMTLG